MPITYQIDHAQQRIRTRCTGEVMLAEVQAHFTALSQDPSCPDRLDVLLDLSEMTNVPSSEQIGAVPIELARVAPRVRFRYCAIIASKEALFGMARMFEVFAEQYFVATRVYRTVAEGEWWLDHPIP
jgi:hypothetical protein